MSAIRRGKANRPERMWLGFSRTGEVVGARVRFAFGRVLSHRCTAVALRNSVSHSVTPIYHEMFATPPGQGV